MAVFKEILEEQRRQHRELIDALAPCGRWSCVGLGLCTKEKADLAILPDSQPVFCLSRPLPTLPENPSKLNQ
ncbi:hypothetical protein GCK32_000134 [Trichostrongylus colubriformis]|uniref:Uncharacterized protein n=1 Tax=Trichostrongylus colubriformis TaxID=6319 RepID=A0AAN8G9X0_TRICO